VKLDVRPLAELPSRLPGGAGRTAQGIVQGRHPLPTLRGQVLPSSRTGVPPRSMAALNGQVFTDPAAVSDWPASATWVRPSISDRTTYNSDGTSAVHLAVWFHVRPRPPLRCSSSSDTSGTGPAPFTGMCLAGIDPDLVAD